MRSLAHSFVVSLLVLAAPPLAAAGAEPPYNVEAESRRSDSPAADSYYGRSQPAMIPSDRSPQRPPLGSTLPDTATRVASASVQSSTIVNSHQRPESRDGGVKHDETAPLTLDANHGAMALPLTSRGTEDVVRPTPSAARQTPGRALMTVGSSLAIVLGLFFMLAWLTRRAGPAVAPLLPTEVVEVLGRSALTGRQQLNLVRLGRRLLLLSVTTTGAETLAEITEQEEVDRIMDLLEGSQIGGASATLRGVLSRFN